MDYVLLGSDSPAQWKVIETDKLNNRFWKTSEEINDITPFPFTIKKQDKNLCLSMRFRMCEYCEINIGLKQDGSLILHEQVFCFLYYKMELMQEFY